jgi:peptide/nickel transport system substrate-binding protein
MRSSRRIRAPRALALLAVTGMVVAACGGGGKKSTATGQQETTSTTATSDTTATTAATGDSTSTTAASPTGATTKVTSATKTTARSTTKTTAKQFGSTSKNTVVGGIANVTAAPTTAAPSDVQPGGTLTYLKVSDGVGLDLTKIANSGNSDGPPAFMIYDALVWSNPDTGSVDPQTAQSLTSSDGLVWTLKLRPNIKFSDGTPYDAAAVKFNWERLADPKNSATRAQQAQLISTMDVLDPITLKITLKAVNAVFPESVTLIPFIGSPTAIQQKGDGFNTAPVGAGPFLLQSWVRDSQMVLVRNPGYWNAPLPYLDKVVVKPIQDENQRINSFKAGEANFMYTNLATSYQTLQSAGGVPNASVINGGTEMFFNVRKAPFNDPRARQAVTMALDRADMAKVLDNGVLTPMNSAFRDNSPFFDSSVQQLPYDPAKAQQLFDAIAADNGGKPLTFTLTAFNTGIYVPSSQYIQSKLNSFKNVKVDVSLEASAVHQTNANQGNFTGSLYATPFDDPEPTWVSQFDCNNPASPTGFCDQKYQADAADQRATLDPKKRVADIVDMQKIIYSQVPVFYYEHRAAWDFSAPNVQNVHLVNDGLALYDRIWIKQH